MDHGLNGHVLTIPKIRRWAKQVFGCQVSRNLLRSRLHELGLSWKKCQKVLKKANPAKRRAFIEQFRTRFTQLCRQEILLVYIDEIHIHRDLELGYTWADKGAVAWRISDCPPLSDRLNWYGAYDFSWGQCLLWEDGSYNKENTVQFLHLLADWLETDTRPVVLIWDGASYHRAQIVQAAADRLGFTLMPLPGYSPDLNPIEGLWKWMREEVTQQHCHASMHALR